MKLRGPAHPENFRVKVGRYGDRWYRDQLPDDGIWGPMDEPVPSVTTVKNAWPKYLTNWAAGECSTFAYDNLDSWKNLDRRAAIDLISKAHLRSRDASGARGTAIHEAIEGLAETGQIPMMELVGLEDYEAVLKALCDDLQPEFMVSEAVAIKQGDDGYGGTLDAIAKLFRYGRFLVDWKTRKVGKGGTAYPDEFAQGAAYRSADYLIVTGESGDAERVPVPDTDGVAVITIEPEGYAVCVPDDMGKANETWHQLRRFWNVQTLNPPRSVKATQIATSTAGTAAGGPADAEVETVAPPSPSVSAPSPDHAGGVAQEQSDGARLEWFDARYDEILAAGVPKAKIAEAWPDGLPTPKARDTWTSDQLEQACKVVTELHHGAGLAFPPPDPAAPAPARPSKLRRKPKATKTLAAPKDCEDLVAAYHALDEVASTDVTRWQGQGVDAGRPWSAPTEKVSRWHWAVNSAAVGVARHAEGDTEIARGWIALVIGEDDCQTHPIGALLGSLSTSEAEKLAALTQSDTFAAAVAAA